MKNPIISEMVDFLAKFVWHENLGLAEQAHKVTWWLKAMESNNDPEKSEFHWRKTSHEIGIFGGRLGIHLLNDDFLALGELTQRLDASLISV